MKTALTVALLVCSAAFSSAQERLADQLRKGIVQEEANQNLEKAISAYQAIIAQFDADRKTAATALFRLAECYRKSGKREQAVAAYQRVVREFADQAALVEPSRLQLASTYGLSEPRAARPAAPAVAAAERDRLRREDVAAAAQRDVQRAQFAVRAAERELQAIQDKIKDYQIQIQNKMGSPESTEYRQLQRDLEAARDRLQLAMADLREVESGWRAPKAPPREVTPEALQATQVELATLDKRLADMKRRVDAGTVSAKELQELQAQYQLLTLRYQQQLKDRDASEAASREGRALTERMIKSVETEIALIQQRIALLDKQVEAGTASSANAELLQLRRDLLGLQRRLDELKVGIRR